MARCIKIYYIEFEWSPFARGVNLILNPSTDLSTILNFKRTLVYDVESLKLRMIVASIAFVDTIPKFLPEKEIEKYY